MKTDTDHEAAWRAWSARHGVPTAVGEDVPSTMRPGYEIMGESPVAIPVLTSALGQFHAWLHEQPSEDAPGPTLTWSSALAELHRAHAAAGPDVDHRQVMPRLRRLDRIEAFHCDTVACHGDFTPVTVHVNTDDHHDVLLSGWEQAVLADREYDVSYSELGFWVSPYLTPEREQRAMLRVARSFLLSGYRSGYRTVGGELDPTRMRLWGAFHACRLFVSPLATTEPFCTWHPDVAAVAIKGLRLDLADRFDQLLPGGEEDDIA